jgi:putative membrane protein
MTDLTPTAATPTDSTSRGLAAKAPGTKIKLVIIVCMALLVPVSFIGARYPQELVLQHIPTLVALAILATFTLATPMSSLSFVCVVGFLGLHVIGARWIYSFVPYDDWSIALTGRGLSERFGWERNHYDRLVHFGFGVFGVPPASEALQRLAAIRPLGSAVLAVAVVVALGALYEIAEWQIAMTFSPEFAESYNGQQGDIWDAQKDQAMALIGALISLVIFARWRPGEPSSRS